MYTVICDGCGKDVHEGCEISAWGDKGYVQDVVMEQIGFEKVMSIIAPIVLSTMMTTN